MNLEAQLVTVSELSGQERDCMFALMDRYYAGMKRDFFNADLDEKHWAILLRDSDSNVICGFSTQMLMDFTVDGASMHALFSGDTIVEQRCWGQSVLAQAWGRLALELINRFPRGSLYWFLISKGYKTYRYLPLFFREYYPRHATPTPPWAKSVIDVLGRQKYPRAYDPSAGIIRAGATACRLRRDVAAVTFCSPSAVNATIAGMGRNRLSGMRVVCLGETTAAAARQAGVQVAAVAHQTSLESLVAAVRLVVPGEAAA